MSKSLAFVSGTVSRDVQIRTSKAGEVSGARFSLACEDDLFYVKVQDAGQIHLCRALRDGDQIAVVGSLHSFVYPRCHSRHVCINAHAVIPSRDETAIEELMAQSPLLRLWSEDGPEATNMIQAMAGDSLVQQLLHEHEERSAYATQVTASRTYTIYPRDTESLPASWLGEVLTLVGVAPHDLEDKDLGAIHADDRAKVEDHLQELLCGRPHGIEFRVFKGGEVRWIHDAGRPVQEGEVVVRVYGVMRDRTDRKWLESQVLELQRTATMNRMVGGVAHEFNNLLTLIMSHAELVRYKLGQNSQLLNGDFDEIIRAAQQASDLTHRLLAFSRHRMVLPEMLDVNALVTDLGEMLKHVVREGIEVSVVTNSEVGYVEADLGQVEQLLMNLTMYICDHTPEAGRLSLEIAGVILDEPQAGLMDLLPGRYVKLLVGGDGCADSLESPQAVDPSEVGLATAYRLAGLIGAHIEATGHAHRQVTFHVYLPHLDEAEVMETVKHAGEEPQASQTVLVVEDEDRVRGLVSDILRSHGFSVLEARSGEEALELCQCGQGPIHVAVTDVMLPGMSGPQLIDCLTDLYPQIGALFISGYVEVPFAPPDGKPFLRKPFSPADLVRTVYQAMGEQGNGHAQSEGQAWRSQ